MRIGFDLFFLFLISFAVPQIWSHNSPPPALNSPLFKSVTMPSARTVIAWLGH